MLAENASDVVLLVDSDYVIRWVSPAVTPVLGWNVRDVVGRPRGDFVEAFDIRRIEETRRRGDESTVEIRARRADGSMIWMASRSTPIADPRAEYEGRVVALRDIDAEVRAREAQAASEERLRLLAEHASDIVVQTDADGVIEWISPSVHQVLGVEASDAIGRELADLVLEEDRERALAWRSLVHLGNRSAPHEYRYRAASGEARWMSVRSEPVTGEDGRLRAVVVALRDVTSEVLARRAVTTLSEGSRVLARADREDELLCEMCQVAVDEAGYAFAWYGRKVHDETGTVDKVATSGRNRAYLEDIDVAWADVPAGRGPTGRAIRLNATVVIRDLLTDPNFGPWLVAAAKYGFRSAIAVPVRVAGEVDGALLVYALEPAAFDSNAVSMFEDLAGELGVGLGRLRDHERLTTSLGERTLLISAIEQAGEAIVLTDPLSNITYANPAVTRVSGYSREELIGANPRVFQSGHHPHEFYLDMWTTLLGGRSWRGVLVNRNKTGSLFEEDATISPIHNAEGALVAYVAVKHDLTNERRLEASLDRARTDHGAIVAAMRDVQPAESVQASAGLLCEAATQLPDVDAAAVLLTNGSRALIPVGLSGSRLLDVAGPTPISLAGFDPATELAAGPVSLPLEPLRWVGNEELLDRVIADGLRAIVVAPVHWERHVIGLLALGTRSPTVAEHVTERLTLYEELASYAGTLLGGQARAFGVREDIRARLRDVLEHRRFHPVFQPVVDLATARVVGYEALTRFDDARRPDEVFAEAHAVGLGTELEAACAAAALDAFAPADPGLGLSLNFSPAALLDGSAAGVVVGCGRRVTIEVTEHAPIENFAAVRRAVAAIPEASLAVDDAGAGFASLHHILELHPDFVKLDVSIVRDVDSDRVRQAMAAGLCHFARLSDVTIVAEGVETPGEADALRQLGVSLGPGRMLGQGFFFGGGGPAPTTNC